METAIRVQTLNDPVCISRCDNIPGESLYLTNLSPAIVSQIKFFNIVIATDLGEGKL